MDNIALMAQVTEQMLQKSRIISMKQMQEVNEGSEDLPDILHVIYENGHEQWIKGENEIRNFVNSILATR